MNEKEIQEIWDAIVWDQSDKGDTAWAKVRELASLAVAKLCEEELADAKMTIGVLKATIETREEMEEGLTAKLVVHEATKQRWEKANKVLRGQVNEYDDARLEAEMKLDKAEAKLAVMTEALNWLVHLCHGCSKGGDETSPPSDAEWKDCLTKAEATLSAAPKVE